MPMRELPSLDLLKGFEAAARHLSFTKAGEELFLTQSAISRQVQALEAQLGVQLFQRRIRALLLTDEGQRYFKAVRAALDDLRAATLSVRAGRSSAALTVATTVSFASLWLVPRLVRFQSAHPGIQVRLVAENRIQDLERERIDVAVRYCPPAMAGPAPRGCSACACCRWRVRGCVAPRGSSDRATSRVACCSSTTKPSARRG